MSEVAQEQKQEFKAGHWYTIDDLETYCVNEEEFLVDKLMPKAQLVALVGPSDCGKSTFCRQLALAITAKQPSFLGYDLHVTHGSVCYVSTEDEQYATLNVIKLQRDGMGLQQTNLLGLKFQYETENIVEMLKGFLKNTPTDLVVIDGWADTFEGNPNSFQDVRKNLKEFAKLAKQYRCTVLFLHHNVKNSEKGSPDKNKVNGSQAFEAKCRCVLELRLAPNSVDERLLSITKANHLPQTDKEGSEVLLLDGQFRLFKATNRTVGKSIPNQQANTKYDVNLWGQRYRAAIAKESTKAAARAALIAEFGNAVPGETWFKDNKDKLGGHSESLEKDTDRPIETNTGDIAA